MTTKRLITRRLMVVGMVFAALCGTGIVLNSTIYAHYAPTLAWRLLYGLDALCGIGGFIGFLFISIRVLALGDTEK